MVLTLLLSAGISVAGSSHEKGMFSEQEGVENVLECCDAFQREIKEASKPIKATLNPEDLYGP